MLLLNIMCGDNDWNITFNPPEVTAIPGLCALISCTFTYPENVKSNQNVLWHACNETGKCMKKIFKKKTETQNSEMQETEQIKWLEPNLTENNCSIIIKEIKEEERRYVFKIMGGNSTSKNEVKIIIQDKPTMDVHYFSEGQEANLTCSAPFPCPETPPEITWWIKSRGEFFFNLKDNITSLTSKSFYLSNLTLTLTSDLHNAIVRCDVNYRSKNISTNMTLEVMYVKTLQILGNDKLMEGDTLRLNCTVESHPPSSDPMWSFSGKTDSFMNQTSPEYLTITNVTKKHAGVYGCMITYKNKTLNASITIDVTGHTNQSSFSPGSKNMPLNDTRNTTGIEDFIKNLDIPTILTFVAGMACSAFIFSVVLCCWVSCHRGKKHKVPTANPDTEVNLETVQMDVARTGTNEQTPLHGQLNKGNPNMDAPTDGAEEDEAVEMEVVDYASIDYSLLKDRPPEEVQRESTDTDYAEIKRDRRRDGKEREVLQDGDDEIEKPDQMQGEEELYSNSQELS
ncbi:hypothetical protein QQF64_008944 [Cirrhinus molitorella]|uniref:Ig-like domain-containing protein n=1 Tax=Cirrhinus molitorella TaxID=172907 RepID=A0ABR3MB17_9TELE